MLSDGAQGLGFASAARLATAVIAALFVYFVPHGRDAGTEGASATASARKADKAAPTRDASREVIDIAPAERRV